MAKNWRTGLAVQTVFPSKTVPDKLKSEAKRRGTTVAALVRKVLKSYVEQAL